MNRKLLVSIGVILLIAAINSFSKEKSENIKIMYFHATERCQGCLALEGNVVKSVNELYETELKAEMYNYDSIDFLAEENEKFVELYKIETQTLIISKVVEGKEVKWINLDKIWDYAGSYPKMKKYIDREMKKLLKS